MNVRANTLQGSDELEILWWPDDTLGEKCEPVGEVTEEIRQLARSMIFTMIAAPGLGLAAPQVGVLKRLVVVDPAADEENSGGEPFAMINPVIIQSSGEVIDEEGCLSMPGIYADIARPEELTVEYTSAEGGIERLNTRGFMARCVAHEIDHLNGVLFWDHLNKFKRDWLKLRFKRKSATV
ncbi:MAG: peptide deformylase [Nitrospinae bacterium]|nr:peptide deformylase [Nitrospinota bacterium]